MDAIVGEGGAEAKTSVLPGMLSHLWTQSLLLKAPHGPHVRATTVWGCGTMWRAVTLCRAPLTTKRLKAARKVSREHEDKEPHTQNSSILCKRCVWIVD